LEPFVLVGRWSKLSRRGWTLTRRVYCSQSVRPVSARHDAEPAWRSGDNQDATRACGEWSLGFWYPNVPPSWRAEARHPRLLSDRPLQVMGGTPSRAMTRKGQCVASAASLIPRKPATRRSAFLAMDSPCLGPADVRGGDAAGCAGTRAGRSVRPGLYACPGVGSRMWKAEFRCWPRNPRAAEMGPMCGRQTA
jgi:hypothetical protein